MNKSPRRTTADAFTTESALYLLAFFLALFLRLLNLGQSPLTDGEAAWALQALQVAQPGAASSLPGASPAYIFLTGITFSIFGASEFLARFWPALVGALIVWLPCSFRHEMGRKAALILAFGLAVDPGLVTVSRQASGPMLALGFSLFALAAWHARRLAWAGAFAGLALLSGPAFWQGALGLGLAWLLYRLLLRSTTRPGEVFDESDPQTALPTRADILRGLVALFAAVLLVGAYLLRYPQSLASLMGSLSAYLDGWTMPSGVSPLAILISLFVFQPLGIIFALVSLGRWLVRHFQREIDLPYPMLLPLLWLLISLVLTLVYPARQVSDLVWVLVPLWALAADGLAVYLPDEKPSVISWLQAGLVLVLAALFWNTLIATSQIVPQTELPWPAVQLGILFGILALGAMTTALVSLGWSWTVSRDGLVWGLTAAFTIYSLAILWGSAQLRPNQPQELWGPAPGIGQVRLVQETITDLSEWHTGLGNKIEIVSTIDTPSIRWALRDFTQVRYIPEIPIGEMPAVLLTRQSAETPELTAAYRGQDFVWWLRPAWDGPLPADFVSWLTFRKAELEFEHIILWARSDLFPGGSTAGNVIESRTAP